MVSDLSQNGLSLKWLRERDRERERERERDRAKDRPELDKLEALLHHFYVTLRPAMVDMSAMTTSSLLANVSVAAADKASMLHQSKISNSSETCSALMEATRQYYNAIEQHAASQHPALEVPEGVGGARWVRYQQMPQPKSNSTKSIDEVAKLLPKAIRFVQDGMPYTQQDQCDGVRKIQTAVAVIPWREWLSSTAAQDLDLVASDQAAILLVLRSLHTKGGVADLPIEVTMGCASGKKAAKMIEEVLDKTLEIPPCVPASGHVYSTSTHPHRVAIKVKGGPQSQGV